MKFILSISISAAFLLLFFQVIDFSETLTLIKSLNKIHLLTSIFFLVVSSLLRTHRWYVIMKLLSEKVTFSQCLSPMIGSLALNGILPFRGGDLARVFIFSKNMNVQNSNIMASMVVERVFDLFLILILLSISMFYIDFISIPIWLSRSILSLSLIIVVLALLIITFRQVAISFFKQIKKINFLSKSMIATRSSDFLIETLLGLGTFIKLRNVFSMLNLSLYIWLTQAAVFYFLIIGLTEINDPMASVFSSSVIAISTVIPSSPGYFGSFHYAALLSFDLVFQDKNLGGAYALLSHAIFWLPITLIGLVMLIVDKKYLNILDKAYNSD